LTYIYILYPLIIFCIAQYRKKSTDYTDYFPKISIIIAAHNEENNITRKLNNIFGANYPTDQMEVIVGSDNSTDDTNQILKNYSHPRLKYKLFNQRIGKNDLINELMEHTIGEIIVVSDADVTMNKDALRLLMRHFQDPKIGAVCGKRGNQETETGLCPLGGALYNRYESFLKRVEGQLSSVIGGDGALYAFRKKLFNKLVLNAPDDLLAALGVLKKGFEVVYEPGAIASEKIFSSIRVEFQRKKRTVARGVSGIFIYKNLLNPVRYPLYAFQIISHKILRWLTFFWLGLLLISNVWLLTHTGFYVFMWGQIIFYGLALMGGVFYLFNSRIIPFYIPFYFISINLAASLGIIEFARGKTKAAW
jgi:cellulose synthase/poly-beta-1,6-N-acetylglucosamine synthase-like glycosyltransferase